MSLSYVPLQISPPGMEALSFSCMIPHDWQQMDLPNEPASFQDPSAFQALLVAMATYGVIVYSVGARPGFEDGSVRQWALWIAQQNGLTITDCKPVQTRSHAGIQIDATQMSDDTPMTVRTLFIEDGGRLFNVSVMAPEQVWPSMVMVLQSLIESFTLTHPQGPTHPLLDEGVESSPAADSSAESASPKSTAEPTEESHGETGPDSEYPGIVIENPHANANTAPPDNQRATQPAEVALADDAATLDPEHPMNQRLRDNGVGLVPRVFQVHERQKFAVVGAGAIEQLFRIPLGWHIIDDGKRTLIFDAAGKMQINLSLRQAEPSQDGALLESILSSLAQDCPDLEALKLEMGGMKCLAIRNLLVDGERLQQIYLAKNIGRPDLLLVCRVTADDDNITFAANTAEVILTSMQSPAAPATPIMTSSGLTESEARAAAEPVQPRQSPKPQPQPAPQEPSNPDWWIKAQELEKSDHFEAAEKMILDAVQHLGGISQVSYLYQLRMQRLLSEGNRQGAIEAFRNSARWKRQQASYATSGGEGTALMYEYKQHRKELVSQLGFDPDPNDQV